MRTGRLFALSCCLMLSFLAADVRADLVGLWRFDQNAAPQPDATGNGQVGELMGDVTWVNDLERGGVMEFDGDRDYLEVEDTDLLSIEGDLTIAAWARFESFDNWNSIVAKAGLPELNNHNRPAPYDMYTVNQGNGRPRLYAGDGAAGIGFVDAFDPPEAETWVHLAVTLTEDGDVIHYLDGANNGEGFIGFPRLDLDQNVYIGSRANFETNMLGRLDDVAIFNEVLSEEQIAVVMAGDFSAWGVGGGIPGDFDGNGLLEEPDLNLLTGEINGAAADMKFDVNGDSSVNSADHYYWISELRRTWVGDANLDDEFNSSDLVTVLAAGQYESVNAAVWSSGDFNGDGFANSSDLVAALADGGYEIGPRAATASVPEPASGVLLVIGLLALVRRRT